MKIILAPDSFKDCLRASEVASALREGILLRCPTCDVVELPMADGGEGTVEAYLRLGGARKLTLPTVGPTGRELTADLAVLQDGTCVLEMASAAGLELLSPQERNPMLTSTYGVGILLKQCIEKGYRRFIIGIGGSATVDCGIGMLQGLGYQFFQADGSLIPDGAGGGALSQVASVRDDAVVADWRDVQIISACDVTTPLPQSAVVYGPQKGATPEMVRNLTDGLLHFASLFHDDGMTPGDGAAGGIAFAIRRVLGGESRSGAELLLDQANFEKLCMDADAVITGEGRTDFQSAQGKCCGCIAKRAAALGIPVILASGALVPEELPLDSHSPFTAMFSISTGPSDLATALANTKANLQRFGWNIASLITNRGGL